MGSTVHWGSCLLRCVFLQGLITPRAAAADEHLNNSALGCEALHSKSSRRGKERMGERRWETSGGPPGQWARKKLESRSGCPCACSKPSDCLVARALVPAPLSSSSRLETHCRGRYMELGGGAWSVAVVSSAEFALSWTQTCAEAPRAAARAMRPRALLLSRPQRPLQQLLLLLLAAAARDILCNSYERGYDKSELDHSADAAPAEASVLEAPAAAAGTATATAEADGDVAADGLLGAAAGEEVGFEESREAPASLADEQGAAHRDTTASHGSPWLQRQGPLPSALGGALLGLLLLFVIASERRFAGARAALAQNAADAALSAEERGLLQGALHREDRALEVLQEQVQQTQQERRQAMLSLSSLAKKRGDLSARLVLLRGSSAKRASLQHLDAARDRMQRALDAKSDALRELGEKQLLQSLTEETAQVFIWHLADEKAALEREGEALDRCTEGLKQAETLEQAAEVKRREEADKKQALAKAREELELLEAQEAETATAAARAGAAGAEPGELAAMRITLGAQRRSVLLRAEEEEELLSAELVRLRKAPAYYSKAFERMQLAGAELKRLKDELAAYTQAADEQEAKARQEEALGAKEREQLELLYPEEKQLYEARVRLLQLELQKQTYEAQLLVLTSVPERVEYLRASKDLLKVTAAAAPDPSKVDVQEQARVLAEACRRSAAAHQAMEDAEAKIRLIEDALKRVNKQLVGARAAAMRCERKVKALEHKVELELSFPEAMGVSEMERLSMELGNYEMAIQELRSMAQDFTMDAYEDVHVHNRERFWIHKIDRLDAECLHLLHDLFAKGTKLLLAVERAEDALKDRLLRNELQVLPLAGLALLASKGAESELLQQHLERRWEEVQDEIKSRKSDRQTSENQTQMLRRALQDIAAAGYWVDELGPLKSRAYAFIAREEAHQEFCRLRVEYLQTLTREALQKELEEVFSEALWDLKELRESYGVDTETLNAFRHARNTACLNYAERLRSFREAVNKQAEQLAPVISVQDLPVFQVAEKTETRPVPRVKADRGLDPSLPRTDPRDLGDLKAFTIQGALQLRKNKK
ncbi:hypothetical protein Esti_005411 [Eimeria stiedai]